MRCKYVCSRCGAETEEITRDMRAEWKYVPNPRSGGVYYHKCYEESLAPEWAEARLER